jgi:hypothetical protein
VSFNFLAAHRDRNSVDVATSSELTIGTGDQDDAVALAFAGNMTANRAKSPSLVNDDACAFSHLIPSAGVKAHTNQQNVLLGD